MNDTSQKYKDDLVSCEVCLKEIPVSEAKSEDYAIWEAQQKKDDK
jgi:hypothetical protein